MVREVPLTQGKVALVDDDDFDRVMRHKWCAVFMPSGSHWYAKRGISQEGKTFNCFLHRFILGVPDGVKVDHENNDGLDCRKENMRVASSRQNGRNVGAPRSNTSGFKNVIKCGSRWGVRIKTDSGPKGFGTYRTIEEAAAVADAAIRRFHGEFGRPLFDAPMPEGVALLDRYLAGEGALIAAEKRRTTKIDRETAARIRDEYQSNGVPQRVIAAQYGVSKETVSHIVTGRSWKERAA